MAIHVESDLTEAGSILRVSGRVDGETAPEFERICHQAIAPGDRYLVLDFSSLDYISSAGLSSILSAGKVMDARSGRLVLCGLTKRMRQLFRFSGLDALFPIFESCEAALADCRQKTAKR